MKSMFASAALVLAALGSPADAAISVYTSQADFLAALAVTGSDGYDDLAPVTVYDTPLTRAAGSYGYTVSGGASGLYGAGSSADPWLSIDETTSPITFGGFAANVLGAGANFFGSGLTGGFFDEGSLTLTASDASGTTQTIIANPGTSTFVGFVSTTGLTGMTVRATAPDTGYWPTVDNLVLGGAAVDSAVPEPATWAMMILGMGAIGIAMRRRTERSGTVSAG